MPTPEARGRALATRATTLTLDYAFHISDLRMVWLKVLAPKIPAVRTYEHAGFQRARTLRQSGYWLDEVCDEIIMDALATEFPGPSAIKTLLRPSQR